MQREQRYKGKVKFMLLTFISNFFEVDHNLGGRIIGVNLAPDSRCRFLILRLERALG